MCAIGADLFVLCGCPADSVTHLAKSGLIVDREKNGAMAQTSPTRGGDFPTSPSFPCSRCPTPRGGTIPTAWA
jgi:hypothetical protein